MFLASQNKSAATFFIKRLLRVVPAYWFYTSCLVIFVFIFPKEFAFADYNSISLIKSYLFIPTINPSGIGVIPFLTVRWTLIFEIVFYTILAVSILLSKKYSIIICFLLVGFVPFIFPEGNVYSHVLGEYKIYQFLVGLAVGAYFKSILYNRINILISPVKQSILLLLISFLLLSGIIGYGLLHKTIAAGFIVLSFILLDSKVIYSGRLASFFVRQGNNSYSVYLSHVLILGMLLSFFGNQLTMWQEILVIMLLIILVHAVSLFSYKYVENGVITKKLDKLLIKVKN